MRLEGYDDESYGAEAIQLGRTCLLIRLLCVCSLLAQAKGLEWDMVYLPGLTDGAMPLAPRCVQSYTLGSDLDELATKSTDLIRSDKQAALVWRLHTRLCHIPWPAQRGQPGARCIPMTCV